MSGSASRLAGAFTSASQEPLGFVCASAGTRRDVLLEPKRLNWNTRPHKGWPEKGGKAFLDDSGCSVTEHHASVRGGLLRVN